MKRRRFLTGTVGVLVLSAGLTIMADSAGAAPTTKSTPTQNWDANLPSDSRFTTVFTGAVRDNNTGLVWEQAPDITGGTRPWASATSYCVSKNVGGTVGWRLPSVVELNSVRDPSLAAPFVPASAFTIGGSPGVQSSTYWSATSSLAPLPSYAWGVNFGGGNVFTSDKDNQHHAWCVRGGMNADQY